MRGMGFILSKKMEIFMKECGKVGLKTAKGLWNKGAGLFMKDHGDKRHGYGIYRDYTGNIYEGEWKNGWK